MKTHSTRRPLRFLLSLGYFAQYTPRIYELEKALARKPATLQIDIVGSGELPTDAALLIRSVLLNRSPQTHLITNARSSLQGGAVLVWLLGDTRLIRDDARLYFRQSVAPSEEDEEEPWKEEESKTVEMNPEEADYAQVLEHINAYLPVNELAGCPIGLQVLKQFGLVDNEKVDQFLASAFAKRESPPEPPTSLPAKAQSPPPSKVPPAQK